MRNLPLENKEWRERHIAYNVNERGGVKVVCRKLSLICDVSDADLNHLMYSGLRNRKFFFQDETGEIFIYKSTHGNAMEMTSEFTGTAMSGIKDVDFYINTVLLRNSYLSTAFVDSYLNLSFDLSKLSSSSYEGFRDFAKNRIKINKRLDYYSLAVSLFKELAVPNENVVTRNMLNMTILKEFKDLGVYTIDKESEILIRIKYVLIQSGSKFSGGFAVRRNKFDDTDKRKVFDGFIIEMGMADSNYNDNLNYVKSNLNCVKQIIKVILENHKTSKDYAKYMKMYSFTLLRNNVLVAQFCFKNELENLIAKREEK